MTHNMTLEVTDICVALGALPVLRNASLEVPEGSTVALVGRNGAGKTTTLRTVMGLIRTDTGSVYLSRQSIGHLPAHQRARLGIGYAPEEGGLVSSMSADANLRLPAQACKLGSAATTRRLERIYELLPEVARIKRQLAGALSGGQQKMVALGRALVVGERLLLLDEPFQGLAPAIARRYADSLIRLREYDETLSILVSESNPGILKPIAEVFYTIERGEVVRTPETQIAAKSAQQPNAEGLSEAVYRTQ